MRLIHKMIPVLAFASLLAAGVPNGEAKKKTDSLTIAGSTTVLPIAQACSEAFMDANAGVNISVRGGGSSVGIAAIIDGTVDIGDSSRPIQTKEMALARSKGRILKEYTVARDGLAIIVHTENATKALTLAQVKDIFTGKISNWKDAGGPNLQIVLISRDTSSGTFETFKEKVLKGAKVREGALMVAANQAVLTTVRQTPGGIGYVGVGFLSEDVKVLPVNGITGSQETVMNDSYPISRKLYMYVNGEPQGLLKRFLGYILSPEGQALVEEVGYVRVR